MVAQAQGRGRFDHEADPENLLAPLLFFQARVLGFERQEQHFRPDSIRFFLGGHA